MEISILTVARSRPSALCTAVAIVGLLAASPTPSQAHYRFDLKEAPRQVAALAPQVDATCDLITEYANADYDLVAYGGAQIAARVFLLSTAEPDAALYVCVNGLTLGNTQLEPLLGVFIDVDHDGEAADADDLGFLQPLHEMRFAARGDTDYSVPVASDFVATAAIDPMGLVWHAEMRIPLDEIGGGVPGTRVGIHVAHNEVFAPGDGFGWVTWVDEFQPYGWLDLRWSSSPVGPGLPPALRPILLDSSRITQGLEFDTDGTCPTNCVGHTRAVPFRRIAGKETLVQAGLFTRGAAPSVVEVECLVTSPSGSVTSVAADPLSPGDPVTLPTGTLVALSPALCWVPGDVLEEVGEYRFELRLVRDGQSVAQRIPLGSASFEATIERLNLALYRHDRNTNTSSITWSASGRVGLAILGDSLFEFHRMTPLRGRASPVTSPFLNTSAFAGSGLLGVLAPGVTTCAQGGFLQAPGSGCDDYLAGRFQSLTRASNAVFEDAGLDFRLHETASMRLMVFSGPTGGRCDPDYDVSFSDLRLQDNQGVSPSVLTHEVHHCLGEVRPTSQHWSTASPNHSANRQATGTGVLANVRTRNPSEALTPAARSVMYGTPGGAGSPSASKISFSEGLEWNKLHDTLLQIPGASASAEAAQAAGPSLPRFHVFGTIDASDNVTIFASQRFDLPLELTPDDPMGGYGLALLDADGVPLESLQFEPAGNDSEGGSESAGGFVLTLPLATGAVQFEISKGAATLHLESFATLPPSVGSVAATPFGDDVEVEWTASHPEGKTLRYTLYYQGDPAEPALPIAMGVTSESYFFDTDFVPPASAATITVEATDGLKTDQVVSNAFAVAAKPPVAAILLPPDGEKVVAGKPFLLEGFGFDAADGVLTGPALSWKSDLDGPLGTGERIDAVLSPLGSHVLELTVLASSGLSAAASVQVVVEADGDGDGVSDADETAHSCLDELVFDSDSDPDGDKLRSLTELELKTDPCDPDTDGDRFVDDDEVRRDADPSDADSQPSNVVLATDVDFVDLGACPTPNVGVFDVLTQPPGLAWEATTDVDWLLATGSGAGDGFVDVSANCVGLPPGVFFGKVLVAAVDAPVSRVTARLANADGDTSADNCLGVVNAKQADTDNDGFGNLCDCDFDQDLLCGAADKALLESCLGMPVFPGSDCEAFDLDGDGDVDAQDEATLAGRLGEPPGPSALPEPDGLILLVTGVAWLALLRRLSARSRFLGSRTQ
jgi:hypothetical protein